GRRVGDAIVGVLVDVTEQRRDAARQAEEQAALLRLSTSEATARGDFDAALKEIVVVGSALLDVARLGVWLLSTDGEALECVAQLGAERDPTRYAATAPAYFAELRSRRLLAAPDVEHDPRTRELAKGYLAPNGVVALLHAPVYDAGKLVGALIAE